MKYAIKLTRDIEKEVQDLLLPYCIPENFSEHKTSDILGDIDLERLGCGISSLDLSFISDVQIIIFRTMSNSAVEFPHIDGVGELGKKHEFAINIPLKGCDKGEMVFYSSSDDGEERYQMWKGKFEYHTWRPNPDTILNEEERIVVNRPYLINPSDFHHIDNSENPEDRYIASIRFKHSFPTWEQAKEIFSDLIVE